MKTATVHDCKSRTSFVFGTLLSAIISLFLTPVVACIVLITIIRRSLVSLHLRVKYGKRVKLIDCMDSFQVFDRPNNTLETYTFLVLEGTTNLDKIRAAVTRKLLNNEDNLYDKLMCKVVTKGGYYCWENIREDEFSIANHVRLARKDEFPEDVAAHNYLNNNAPLPYAWTEEEALQKLSEMYSNPLPITLPRWELVVFPNFTYLDNSSPIISSEGKTYYAMILRIHHSLMDGISSYLLLSFGLADYPEKCAIDPLKPLDIPFYSKMFKYIKLWVLWPKMLYENTVVGPETNCFHGPDLTGPKILGYTKPIEMAMVKNIRLNLKSTTAAVFNAAVGGSFHMLANDEGLQSPERFTAVTSIPMLPYPNLKPQNRFSGAFFPLEVAGAKNRTERVLATHSTLKSIVQSPLVLLNSWLLRFIGILPASLSQNLTDARELSVLTSNVPGPNKHLCFFGGDRLVDVTGWLPIKNKTGFGICFVSYCGMVRAAFVADQAVASSDQVKFLTNALEQEIMSLEAELRLRDDFV